MDDIQDQLAQSQFQQKALTPGQPIDPKSLVAPVPSNNFPPTQSPDQIQDQPLSEAEFEKMNQDIAAQQKRSAEAQLQQGDEKFLTDPEFDEINADILKQREEARYGTGSQQALTALEGAGKGLAGPVFTGAETAASEIFPELAPEHQIKREEHNPLTHIGAEIGGLGAGALLPGPTQTKLLGEAGHALMGAVGIGEGVGALAKIGSTSARLAAENVLYGMGDEAGRLIQGRPSELIETVLPRLGLDALIGGAFGAGAGGVSALWRKTVGAKTGNLLEAVSERLGGIEGAENHPVHGVLARTGMEDIPPEIAAGMTNNPAVREMFSSVMQHPSQAGLDIQATKKKFLERVSEHLAENLGMDLEKVPKKFDKHTIGKEEGEALSTALKAKLDPLKKVYRDVSKFSEKKKLEPSISEKQKKLAPEIRKAQHEVDKLRTEHGMYRMVETPIEVSEKLLRAEKNLAALNQEVATPGTIDKVIEDISNLAIKQEWVGSPSSDIMKEINRIIKELPLQKTLGQLTSYIARVGENMQGNKLNGPLVRAGRLVKQELRKAETELIEKYLQEKNPLAQLAKGKKGEPSEYEKLLQDELVKYRKNQGEYADLSDLVERLNAHLHIPGINANNAHTLVKEMAHDFPERIYDRLRGKNNAELLNILTENFKEAANAVRRGHVEQILTHARDGDHFSPWKILNEVKKMTPQLQSFVIPKEAQGRVDAIGSALEKLKDSNYNFSNTGRALLKYLPTIPGSTLGLITGIAGHSPILGGLITALSGFVSHEAPSAMRVALLKWLGSNKPIEPGAFKSMVDLVNDAVQGRNLMINASKAVIKGTGKVIPEHLIPDEKKLKQLDERLQQTSLNPARIVDGAESVAYYLPDHGIAATTLVARVDTILNQLRPKSVKQAPLDTETKVNSMKEDQWHRDLSIAQQPLMVLDFLDKGQMMTKDWILTKTLYPDFAADLQQQLTQDMADQLGKGEDIRPGVLIGLSKILEQPLVSSLKPERILSGQVMFAQASAQQDRMDQAARQGKPGPTVGGMSKLNVANRTSLERSDDNMS